MREAKSVQDAPAGRSRRAVGWVRKAPAVVVGAFALVVGLPGTALADPPQSLPMNATELEKTFQPAYDYDTDGCYATPAIGPDGTIAPGLKTGGDVNGNCRDASDLENTNGYSRTKCNNGWCALVYASYFEKDQAALGGGSAGHRHDWEHVVVWVHNDQVEYVSTSNHGGFTVHHKDALPFEGTHPKVVYHKDGVSTHCFRAAKNDGGDEPPENHRGTWQFPTLVGWDGYPEGLRDKLTGADFGSATLGIKDDTFNSHLAAAVPDGIPFDPGA
ncbi:NPP1 family protein [Streptomyces sp. B15]|uniref:NPP1 family protein n=1 Tax=Streptomyces sp. B15 TaxID=1537797 RepID=UPI001B39531A|nr:NPP1 family protein [Streptomyces sp. B15]MBQ1124164.1 NPP1 family protein [Streptomyces sp. B15]